MFWDDSHVIVSHKGHQVPIVSGSLTQLGRAQGGSVSNTDTAWIIDEGKDQHSRGVDSNVHKQTHCFVMVVSSSSAKGSDAGGAVGTVIVPQTRIIEEIGAQSRGGHGGQQIHLMLMQEAKTTFSYVPQVVRDCELEVRKL